MIYHCLFTKIATGYPSPCSLWGGTVRQDLENIKKERAATHKVIFARQFRTKEARNFP